MSSHHHWDEMKDKTRHDQTAGGDKYRIKGSGDASNSHFMEFREPCCCAPGEDLTL